MTCWFGHEYRAVAARPVRVTGDMDSYDGTAVLLVCDRCQKPKTRTVKGTWTFTQMYGGDAS